MCAGRPCQRLTSSWSRSNPWEKLPDNFNVPSSFHCFAGPFATDDSIARAVCSAAASLVAEAKTNHLTPAELQLDFDCSESKLDGYRAWVQLIRNRIAPIPVTITTLPGWLKQPAFRKLVQATDGYVLQVHSLEKPKSFGVPFTLCVPDWKRVSQWTWRLSQFQSRFSITR